MKVGDVVIHPHKQNRPKRMGLVCVVIAICDKPERGYFILATLKKNGTPSKNRKKWHYLHINQIERCEAHQKYPFVFVCPDCQTEGYTLIEAPLNYDLKCVMCKQRYIIQNDEPCVLSQKERIMKNKLYWCGAIVTGNFVFGLWVSQIQTTFDFFLVLIVSVLLGLTSWAGFGFLLAVMLVSILEKLA